MLVLQTIFVTHINIVFVQFKFFLWIGSDCGGIWCVKINLKTLNFLFSMTF
jgi:hypothetical protein